MVQCMIGFANFKVWQILSLMHRASQVALGVKNLPAKTGDVRDVGSIPGWGRSPGGGHGNPLEWILAWRIPWTEEPDGLQSIGLHRGRHDWSDLAHTHASLMYMYDILTITSFFDYILFYAVNLLEHESMIVKFPIEFLLTLISPSISLFYNSDAVVLSTYKLNIHILYKL